MQPTFTHVPPSVLSISTHTVESPNWPARMAATYPPGPPPRITTSASLLSLGIGTLLDQHRRGVLHQRLHAHQEEHRLLAIDDPVVVRERDVHHGSYHHLSVDGDRPVLDLVQAEDSRLGIVE